MKTSILIYTIGLILIATSITLVVLYPDSNRTSMIAGGLAIVGFILNIAGFNMKSTPNNLRS